MGSLGDGVAAGGVAASSVLGSTPASAGGAAASSTLGSAGVSAGGAAASSIFGAAGTAGSGTVSSSLALPGSSTMARTWPPGVSGIERTAVSSDITAAPPFGVANDDIDGKGARVLVAPVNSGMVSDNVGETIATGDGGPYPTGGYHTTSRFASTLPMFPGYGVWDGQAFEGGDGVIDSKFPSVSYPSCPNSCPHSPCRTGAPLWAGCFAEVASLCASIPTAATTGGTTSASPRSLPAASDD